MLPSRCRDVTIDSRPVAAKQQIAFWSVRFATKARWDTSRGRPDEISLPCGFCVPYIRPLKPHHNTFPSMSEDAIRRP